MNPQRTPDVSVVIPCHNEEASLRETVEQVRLSLADDRPHEVIVVDDGSTDGTGAVIEDLQQRYADLVPVKHERNLGYGAALKSGIARARAPLVAIVDADGTYPLDRLPELVARCEDQDMVVGARTGRNVSYSSLRALPKFFLTRWVSWLAKRHVPDINSGLRVFRKELFERFAGILPDGFSFTITITLAALTNYYRTVFIPIDYHARTGASKIRPVSDTLRFVLIVLRTGTYFAPVRVFGPVFLVLLLASLLSTAYDVFWLRDLTDKTILLFLFSLNVAMFALIADMIDKRNR